MTPTPTTDSAVSPVRELKPIEQAFDALTNLARDLRAELEKPGMTIRNVAAFTGVDKSTVLRAKQQKPISSDAYIALSLWLNLSRRSPDTADGVERNADIEKIAWNCNDWPKWLGDEVERAMAVSDDLDMSTEQVLAYAILASRTPNTEMVVKAEPVALLTVQAIDSGTGSASVSLVSPSPALYALPDGEYPLYLASPPSPAEVTPEMVETAAEVMWDDNYVRHAGPWKDQKPDRVMAIQVRATARAMLTAALQLNKKG